jgi:hypothetical protein
MKTDRESFGRHMMRIMKEPLYCAVAKPLFNTSPIVTLEIIDNQGYLSVVMSSYSNPSLKSGANLECCFYSIALDTDIISKHVMPAINYLCYFRSRNSIIFHRWRKIWELTTACLLMRCISSMQLPLELR